jgi:hypothetical protein
MTLSAVLAQGMAALEPALLATFGVPLARDASAPARTRSSAA